MSARFAAICGADTFGVAKPDPAILQQTLARAGGRTSAAVMVGDAGPDIGAARRAGVPVIGVSFGYTDVPIAGSETGPPDRPHARSARCGRKPHEINLIIIEFARLSVQFCVNHQLTIRLRRYAPFPTLTRSRSGIVAVRCSLGDGHASCHRDCVVGSGNGPGRLLLVLAGTHSSPHHRSGSAA